MPNRSEWNLGLIDSAWFGTQYEGQPGRLETRRIGYDSIDLFVGFDPGRMTDAERECAHQEARENHFDPEAHGDGRRDDQTSDVLCHELTEAVATPSKQGPDS